MRRLEVLATPWQDCLPASPFALAAPERLLALRCCRHGEVRYQHLAIERAGEPFHYLYAASGQRVWVLGVFDTAAQADLFLALHNANPLFVPALEQIGRSAPAVRVEQGRLCYPRYAGLYRVGLKSYRVDEDTGDSRLRLVQYVDRYHVQGLGVLPEKEACLAVYSHFDGRLRGCGLC